MKNLSHYKKQKANQASLNRFNAALSKQADIISFRIKQASDKRWNQLKQDLRNSVATLQ